MKSHDAYQVGGHIRFERMCDLPDAAHSIVFNIIELCPPDKRNSISFSVRVPDPTSADPLLRDGYLAWRITL